MEIYNPDTDDIKYELGRAMCGGTSVGDVGLTEYIRRNISIEDLAVFGGWGEEEEMNTI